MTTNLLVSLVIPVLRDTAELTQLLDTLSRDRQGRPDGDAGYEVIVVNGDADDATLGTVRERFPEVRWLDSPRGRAIQMNHGAHVAAGRWLLFLHADAVPEAGWWQQIHGLDDDACVAGAFTFGLSSRAPAARLLEGAVRLRVRLFGLPYGDQGIFVRRQVFEELGGYADLPIMEDIDLVRRLRRSGRIARSPVTVRVSARRWERDGWIRRSTQNVLLLGLFMAGVSPRWLARRYYGWDPTREGPAVSSEGSAPAGAVSPPLAVAVIIPALNEEAAIGPVLDEIPELATSVTVVDNGSTDRTAERAMAKGATVIAEPRKGYGRACLAGLAANPDADVFVFLDADRSDYPTEMATIVQPILDDSADFVLGYREGIGRPVTARLGTGLCLSLINLLWGSHYRDLGPFRAIRKDALERLRMTDQTWGWTIEMQVKATELGLRTIEVPVRQRPRIGSSKISGTVQGTIRAGSRMLATIWSLWRSKHHRMAATRVTAGG